MNIKIDKSTDFIINMKCYYTINSLTKEKENEINIITT